ncbi:MAG: hypothetical protein HFH08_05140 [Bacilli bacterium]|nr:hypothetical protein [Bacilli bacterium]
MAKRKVRTIRFTKGERLVYVSAIVATVMTFVLQVFCSANVGNLNMNIEKIRSEITAQEKQNESLSMKVSELTSFDKVKEVVKEMGLAYNNDSIVIINE